MKNGRIEKFKEEILNKLQNTPKPYKFILKYKQYYLHYRS